MEQLFPGVWRQTLGTPEAFTPVQHRHRPPAAERFAHLPAAPADPPLSISGEQTSRGFLLRAPIAAEEQFYGLGLQLLSFAQRGLKKTLRVNSDPRVDLGDSHAPVPFFLSTAGYGLLVDTARYATFYMGGATPVDHTSASSSPGDPKLSEEELYAARAAEQRAEILVEIPCDVLGLEPGWQTHACPCTGEERPGRRPRA